MGGWKDWTDGSQDGVKYRAPYGAKNVHKGRAETQPHICKLQKTPTETDIALKATQSG